MGTGTKFLTAVAAFVALHTVVPRSCALSFGSPTSYSVGTGPIGIIAGDFNGDGKPDIAVANSGSANVSVLLGNRDGTFRAAVNSGTGGIPSALAAADLNGDGHLDLVVTDETGFVIVMLGRGDGTFYSPTTIPLDASPRSIAVGDFNGDGRVDLAVGQFDANTTTGHATILLGNSDGTFRSPVNFALAGAIPYGLVVADFNSDHHADIAATSFFPVVSILLGHGDGTFQSVQAVSLPTGNSTYSLAVGDFDHDGNPDLFVTNQRFCLSQPSQFDGIAVLLGNGDGSFRSATVPSDTAAYNQATNSSIGDFDDDGNLDLALTSWDGVTGSLSALLGNGDGTFRDPTSITIGANPAGVVAADFNGDGRLDLAAVVTSADSVVVLLNSQFTNSFILILVDAGSGTGTVASNPAGIFCGSSCSSTFPAGSQIALTAAASTNSVFSSWSGACAGSDPNNCVVTMSSDQSVTATFGLAADFAMTIASPNLTVKSGGMATDALTFSSQGGFSGTISLACAVSGPNPQPSCNVSPLSLKATDAATLTVDASTLTAASSMSDPLADIIGVYAAALPLFLFVLGRSDRISKSRRPGLLVFILIATALVLPAACGGGSGNTTPVAPAPISKTYIVTVTATSGQLQHSSTVSVVVQ